MSELTSPPQGLVSAWQHDSEQADTRLARLAGAAADGYIELRFPWLPLPRQPSMNWHLDLLSREVLRNATREPCAERAASANLAERALRANLQRMCRWIGQGAS